MLRDIILTQKQEKEARLLEHYVPRDLKIGDISGDRLIRVITGPRRAGKSLFSLHLLETVGCFGYVNFDDERLITVPNYDEITAAVETVYQAPKFLLLDEVQNLAKWELYVNRLQRKGYRLVITGSNANLLSSELATHLTGRHIPILLFPFSFREYLRALGKETIESEKKEALQDYAERGGFPEPLLHGINRRDYLNNLVRAVLFKDILKRYRLRAVQGLEDLAYYLFSNIGKEYSFRTLSRVTKCSSHHTVEKYLGLLEEAFLFFSLRRFSFKVREQASANKKIYCVDNGLAEIAGFRSSPDRGRLYENLVAIELRKRSAADGSRVFFWRSGLQEEVDFVVQEKGRVTRLIQVSSDVSDPKTKNREIRALIKASVDLHCEDLLVLTDDRGKEEEAEWNGTRRRVRFLPLWKWLSRD